MRSDQTNSEQGRRKEGKKKKGNFVESGARWREQWVMFVSLKTQEVAAVDDLKGRGPSVD